MKLRNEHDNEIRAYSCPNCYLCNSQGNLLYQSLNDRIYEVPGNWNIKKCSNQQCGLAWLDPMPYENEINNIYKVYFTHNLRKNLHHCFQADKFIMTFMRRFFYVCAGGLSLRKKRLELINMYLPKNIKGRLLEVGCGDGFGLARIRKAGWEVEGQEIDPNAAKNAQNTFGLHIHLGKLEDVALPDASYDAITMVHVIEHVYDPLSLFEECYRILKPGGTLVCITPNIESFGHKHFKSFWLHLDPPRHLRLFSPKCMEKFINKLSFCQHNIITTPAGAERTYSDSMDIQRTGKVRLIEQFKWKKAFQAMIFQQRALAMNKKDSISGEEIVVRLVK